MEAARPAEQPLRVLACDLCLLAAPKSPTPLRAGGSGFRTGCPHRNHVWWVGPQPGSRRPTFHLGKVAAWRHAWGGRGAGPGPSPHHSFPLPATKRASWQGSGPQAVRTGVALPLGDPGMNRAPQGWSPVQGEDRWLGQAGERAGVFLSWGDSQGGCFQRGRGAAPGAGWSGEWTGL